MTDDERRECSDPPCAQNWCDKHAKMPGYGLPEDHERRERYAAAMSEENGGYLHAEDHKALGTADAAMAVADEEIRVAKMEAAQIITRRWSARTNRLTEDLRAELEDVKRKHENFKKGSDVGGKEMRKRLTEAEDTISRVNAVLDESGESESASTLVELIRNTLNGADDASS